MENQIKGVNQKTTDRIKCGSDNAIQAAGNAILYGGVIVYPTDTLYGFGVDENEITTVPLFSLCATEKTIGAPVRI